MQHALALIAAELLAPLSGRAAELLPVGHAFLSRLRR
jgi:hypothetical protein